MTTNAFVIGFGVLAAASVLVAIRISIRGRDPLALLACVGALVCSLNEPIYDYLGKIVYASNSTHAYTAFGRQIPLFLRRAITMAPALVVIAVGLDPTRALVLSQVVLSFGIPFALIPLLMFCRDRGLMGTLVNHRVTTLIATGVVAVIVSLNLFLITLLVTGR